MGGDLYDVLRTWEEATRVTPSRVTVGVPLLGAPTPIHPHRLAKGVCQAWIRDVDHA